MGVYITESDLNLPDELLVELTQDDPNSDEVDADVLEAAITSAEAEVNAYLRRRYSLPLTGDTPDVIRRLAATLTECGLHERRPGSFTDELTSRLDRAYATLRRLSRGEMVLDVPTQPTRTADRRIRSTGHTRTFGRDNLKAF